MLKHRKILIGSVFILLGILWVGSAWFRVTAEQDPPPPTRLPFKEAWPTESDSTLTGFRNKPNAPGASGVHAEFLAPGDGNIHGLLYRDGFLWAATRTDPARILKISPDSLSVVDRAVLTDTAYAEDIIAVDYDANGNYYLWAVLQGDSAYIAQLVRINPADMSAAITPLTDMNNGTSLHYAFGKIWVGGSDHLAEVDITDVNNPSILWHDYSALKQPGAEFVQPTEIVADSSYLYVAFLQGDFSEPDRYIGTTFVRIDPNSPTSGYLQQYLTADFPDDMVFTNGHLYSSTEDAPNPSDAYRFPPNLTGYITHTISDSDSYGVFYTPTDPQNLWGAYVASPGIVRKFNLSLDPSWNFTLPDGFNNPSEIVFDDIGNMYVSTWMSPTGVIQYTIPDAVSLSISKSGSDARLSWTNSDSLVHHYEIWRSTDPYFTPGLIGSSPYTTTLASVGSMSFLDDGVLGDVNNNYFYTVRAFNNFGLLGGFSNRVGEISFPIVRNRFNAIAIPLIDPSLADADDLGSSIGASTVSRWVASTQSLTTRTVGASGFNFPLETGSGYFVYTPGAGPAVFSSVGSIPPAGSVSFPITRPVGNCQLNLLSLPLDHQEITNADMLANSIGGVPRISQWNAATGVFTTRTVGSSGTNFTTKIGYPYWPCSDSTGGGSVWP